jgi:glutamate--cysteine ligase
VNDPAARLVADLFAGDASSDLPSVGVELELLPLRLDGFRPTIAAIAETAAAATGIADLTFEPGGQVELNPPPAATIGGAIDAITARREQLRAQLGHQGLGLLATGVEPWHASEDVPLQLRSERYLAMDAHYAAIGADGRAFMRQSGSTQIGVGLRPGAEGRNQWSVANLVAPLLAATFANAPVRDGRAVGHNGARTAIQRGADPGRHHLRWAGLDPATAYADFARAARPLGPAFAGPASFAAHLTTLFPAVRPRGSYLEVRSIDALDGDDLTAAVVLTATVLASPRAATATLARLDGTAAADEQRWVAAAGPGIRSDRIAAEVLAVIEIAAGAATDLPAGYLPAGAPAIFDDLRRRVEARLAPGDLAPAAWAAAGYRGSSPVGAIR